jgi:hypothetical protein
MMGIQSIPHIKLMKKSPRGVIAPLPNGSMVSSVDTDDISRDGLTLDMMTKIRMSKDLKNMVLIPGGQIFPGKVDTFANKLAGGMPLKHTDYYIYSRPANNEERAVYRTLHYNLRHYVKNPKTPAFPVTLRFSDGNDKYRVRMKAKDYQKGAGSAKTEVGHELSLYRGTKLAARVFFYRFGEMRTDIFDEKGSVITDTRSLEIMEKFLRFYYSNSTAPGAPPG